MKFIVQSLIICLSVFDHACSTDTAGMISTPRPILQMLNSIRASYNPGLTDEQFRRDITMSYVGFVLNFIAGEPEYSFVYRDLAREEVPIEGDPFNLEECVEVMAYLYGIVGEESVDVSIDESRCNLRINGPNPTTPIPVTAVPVASTEGYHCITLPEGDGIPQCGGGHDTGPSHVQPSTADQPNEARLLVFVTEEGADTRAVDVHPFATVAELITECGYQPTDYQLFTHGRVEHLDPDSHLADQGICAESMVDCAPIVPRMIAEVLSILQVSEEQFLDDRSATFELKFIKEKGIMRFKYGSLCRVLWRRRFPRADFNQAVAYLQRKVGAERVEVLSDDKGILDVNVNPAP